VIRSTDPIRRPVVVGRPLIAVLVAAAVSVGAAAFAVGRGVASDSGGTSTAAATAATTPPPGGAAAVGIHDFSFDPQTITVKAGAAVAWTNGDPSPHSVKSADGSFVSQNLQTGQTYSTVFAAPGTFPYVCGIHSFMAGTVVVEP
jgi:plastocyanin